MPTEGGRSRPLSSFLLRGLALGAGVAAVAFARHWLGVVEVQGRSMAPALLPGEWLLVEREYFLLGDNRADSRDSRQFGPLPKELLIGPVWLRYWPPERRGLIRPE